jgi:tetratricopeptide (TPR) repeat protein
MIESMTNGETRNDAPAQQTTGSAAPSKMYFMPKPWLLAVVLVIATFVAYWPATRGGFIWDDDDHLTANPSMKASNGLEMIWSSLAVSRYYPLTLTSFWIQHQLWGLNPMPYHVINIALHALSGVLVYFLLRRLRVPAAWLAAALWVLHPVNVESVAWITEMKNTQSGAFFFGAILCFLEFERERDLTEPYGSATWYTLAMLCGAGAMLSKVSTVVLPLALLLCAWWQRGRLGKVDAARITPFFGLAWLMSGLAIVEQRGQVEHKGTAEWSLGIVDRIIVAGKDMWFYAGKILWPTHLIFIYPRWNVAVHSLWSWLPLIGAVVVGIALVVWRRRSWARAGLFGIGFFLIALLPALGFFDVYYFRFSFVADHFQYLASLGVVALAAAAIAQVLRRCKLWLAPIGNIICAVLLAMMAGLTWGQTHIYHDVETLWRDTIAKNPTAWMAHYNLGKTLSDESRMPEAIAQYEEALQMKPDYAEAHNNLGSALAQQGKLTEAVEHWTEAVRIRPEIAEAHYNLGFVAAQTGKTEDAIKHWETVVRIKPNYPDVDFNLGILLEQMGRHDEAAEHYKQALRIKPDYAEARYNLGVLMEHAGNAPEAIRDYEQALKIKPDFVEVQNSLARLLATLSLADGGEPTRAVGLAQQACGLTGDHTAGYLDTLAIAYAAAGQFDEAIATARKAVELARADGQEKVAGEIEARLELFRSGHPYHRSAETASP